MKNIIIVIVLILIIPVLSDAQDKAARKRNREALEKSLQDSSSSLSTENRLFNLEDDGYVETAIQQQKSLTNEFVTLEPNAKKNEKYFFGRIMNHYYIRKKTEKDLIDAYQNIVVDVPRNFGTREEQTAEKKKLDDVLQSGLLKMEQDYNNTIRYLYAAYHWKGCRVFPAKSIGFAKMYYHELSTNSLTFLNNSTLVFNEDLSAFTSNIVSGYPGFPVRFSLNTVVAKGRTVDVDPAELEGKSPDEIQTVINDVTADNLKNNTLSHVLNGGGFLTLRADYPLLSINGSAQMKPKIDVSVSTAFSGEFAELGGSVPSTEACTFQYFGFELKGILPFRDIGDDDLDVTTFAAFVSCNTRIIDGTPAFYRNLNQQSTATFSQVDLSIGVMVKGLKISYTYSNFSKPGLNDVYPSRFSLGYVPNIF